MTAARWILNGSALLLVVVLGCTTRSTKRVELLADSAAHGDYLTAVADIRESERTLYGNLNRFLYWYDQGLLFHYAGRYDSSLKHLEAAEAVLDELYSRSVSNEAAALLTNDNLRPYRGRRYEQVLLNQFLSFNYLALGKFDEALVETRKVQLVFDRLKSEARAEDRYHDEGMSHFISSIAFDAQGERDNATISLYKAVQAYRQGPIPLPEHVRNLAYYRLKHDGREADIAQLDLSPTRKLIEIPGGESSSSEILLIGYAGRGPTLAERVFWGTYIVGGPLTVYHHSPQGDTSLTVLPAPSLPPSELRNLQQGDKTSAGTTFHIKFTLPDIVYHRSETEGFILDAPTLSLSSTGIVLTDLDRLLTQDLQDGRSATLARTALRVVLRTIAAQRAKARAQSESPLLNLLVNIGTDIATDQLEKADTRLCFLMPKTVQLTRLAVPPGVHSIRARAVDGAGRTIEQRVWDDVVVGEGEKKFLFYPCLR